MPVNRNEMLSDEDYAKSSMLPITVKCDDGEVISVMICTSMGQDGPGLVPKTITIERRLKNEILIANYQYVGGQRRYILPQI